MTEQVTKEIKKAESAAEDVAKVTEGRFSKAMGSVGDFTKKALLPATAALTAVSAAAVKVVGDATDLGESINAVNVVFQDASAGILKLSEDSATAVGLSSAAFNSLAVQFSSFAEKIAGPGGDVVKTIEDISLRAADFASVMNIDVADAARIFQSGLAGETEPLKKFGIDLSEAAVKAYALANGIGDGSGQLSEQEKILARYGSLMEQTNKTSGDFANTSDSLANRQRILSAEFTNIRAEIGTALVPAFEKLAGITQGFLNFVRDNTGIVIGLGVAIAGVSAAIIGVNFAIKAYEAITKIATAAQWLWNAAMAANPIGLIIIAVGALVAAVAIAYRKFEGFREVVNIVANAIIGYFETMINAVVGGLNFIIDGINRFTGIFRAVGIGIGEIGRIGEVSFGRIATAQATAADKALQFSAAEREAQKQADLLAIANGGAAGATTDLANATGSAGGAMDKTSKAAEKMASRIKEIRDAIGDGFGDAIKKANGYLEDAKKKFLDFADNVSGAISQSFRFADAQDTAADNVAALNKALEERAEAQAKVNDLLAFERSEEYLRLQEDIKIAQSGLAEAMGSGDPSKIEAANRRLVDAQNDLNTAREDNTKQLTTAQSDLALSIDAVLLAQQKPMTFFDELNAQAARANEFGGLVNQLLAQGLSEEALQQVLDAGVDAGTKIAKEILSSSEGVLRANELVAQVSAIGQSVGLNAATTFKQAGIDAGNALIAGLDDTISKYKVRLKSKSLTPKQLRKLRKEFDLEVDFSFSNVPALANGAIVSGPQLSMIGEAGAEAVIPLARPQRALDLLEASGLANLVRSTGQTSPAVQIQTAIFRQPTDADLIAQKVSAAERARAFT